MFVVVIVVGCKGYQVFDVFVELVWLVVGVVLFWVVDSVWLCYGF